MSEQHSVREGRRPRASVISHVLVAGIALAAGMWLSATIEDEPAAMTSVALASTGVIPQSSALHDAMEQVPSGMEREIETGVIMRPLLSYAAVSGVWCRRFEILAASGRTEAVACRGADMWRIAALATGPGNEEDTYGASAEGSIINTAVDATIDGEPLDDQEELEVLVGRWPIDLP